MVVTVRWANPVAQGLERVDLVVNAKRPPRDPSDGVVVYRGLGTTFVLTLLGHDDVAVYDGGWAEWGDRLDLPVER